MLWSRTHVVGRGLYEHAKVLSCESSGSGNLLIAHFAFLNTLEAIFRWDIVMLYDTVGQSLLQISLNASTEPKMPVIVDLACSA